MKAVVVKHCYTEWIIVQLFTLVTLRIIYGEDCIRKTFLFRRVRVITLNIFSQFICIYVNKSVCQLYTLSVKQILLFPSDPLVASHTDLHYPHPPFHGIHSAYLCKVCVCFAFAERMYSNDNSKRVCGAHKNSRRTSLEPVCCRFIQFVWFGYLMFKIYCAAHPVPPTAVLVLLQRLNGWLVCCAHLLKPRSPVTLPSIDS